MGLYLVLGHPQNEAEAPTVSCPVTFNSVHKVAEFKRRALYNFKNKILFMQVKWVCV